MDQLTTCGICQASIATGLRLCPECGSNPNLAPAQPSAVEPQCASGTDPQADRARTPLRCGEPGCTGTVLNAGDPCPYCEKPVLGSGPRLVILGVPVELRAGASITLGREHGAAVSILSSRRN